MTDGPSLLSLDAPTDGYRALGPRGPGVAKPVDPPSVLSQFWTSARAAAGDEEIQEARRQKAVDDGLAGIVDELGKRGVDGSYSWRLPLPGAQPIYNEDAIWQGVAAARKRDPSAFAGLERDPAAYRAARTAPVDAADADRRQVIERSGWAQWLAGQFAGGLSDPINQAGMLVGMGGARTIAQAALRDAGINLATEAAQAPSRAIERAGRGVETTPAGVATELGLAAGTGALFGGAMKAAEPVAARAASSAGDLARAMRDRIGWARMTDAERAATQALEREDEIVASSPMRPGADTDRYAAQIDALVQAAKTEQPSRLDQLVPLDAPARPRPVSAAEAAARTAADPWEQFKGAVRRQESGGDDAARNSRSTATGRYQVIDSTWLRVARTLPDAQHMSDAGLLGMRTHPVWQEKVMDALGRDYRAALSRVGAVETPGNLYLMHFAGTGGGARILRAAPDTPIEELLGKAAIDANPFLRGKSADEVIDWAHRAMRSPRDGAPVLRRDVFPDDAAGDAEWRTAQAEVAATDAELTAWQRGAPEDGPPRIDDDFDDVPFDWDDPRARPAGELPDDPDWFPGDDVLPPRIEVPRRVPRYEHVVGQLPSKGVAPAFLGNDGKVYAGSALGTHFTAITPELRAIGHQGTGFVDPHGNFLDRVEALEYVNRNGENIRPSDNMAGELDALDYREQSKFAALTPQDEFVEVSPAASVASRDAADGRASPDLEASRNLRVEAVPGKPTEEMERYWAGEAARGRKIEPIYAVRDADGGDPVWWTTSKAQAERMAREDAGDLTVDRIDAPADVTPAARAAMLEGFDGPDSDGFTHQIDSLEHDLRMFLEEDDAAGLTVRLDDEGDVVSAIDALDDLDGDEAAIAAARACLAPPGGGDA